MPVLNEVLEANQRFAERFEKGDLPMPPARQVVHVPRPRAAGMSGL